ncbi:MAG: hypothetical protein LBB10_01060 [Bifidobacteriaceae bacterium]|jgi:diacylglycerol kinase (ATP)|nr:hypothetical protein [Bifidobacteriaceae bacterium]
MKEIGVIVNPTANRGQAVIYGRTVIKLLNKRLGEKGFDIIDLTGETFDQSKQLAKKAIDRGLEALIVVGGDGMVSMGVNLLVGSQVPLGIVPAGSGNDFVRSLKIPVNQPEVVANGIASGILNKSYFKIDVGQAKPLNKGQEVKNKYFVSILCGGVDAAISNTANLSPIPSSTIRYLSASYYHLSKLAHYGYKLTVNNEVIEKDLELLSVCNTSYYGNGIKIAHDANPQDGLFDIIYSSGVNVLKAISVFSKAMIGIKPSNRAVTTLRSDKIIIEASGLGSTPPDILADGEKVGNVPLEVSVIPKALNIIMPPKVLEKFQ